LAPGGKHLLAVDERNNVLDVFEIGAEGKKLKKLTAGIECGTAPCAMSFVRK
jgi:6-phosphogluconolactonase (cycloisomerase 2 family)